MATPFVGEIRALGFNFAPTGWVLCDGRLLPISEYSVLFNLIGTTYGGDGQTTFAVPDLRGRFAVHQGQGSGLGNYIIGENGGVENVTLTGNQIPNHSHAPGANSNSAGSRMPAGNVWAKEPTAKDDFYSTLAPDTPIAPATLSNSGGSQPHSNLQPYLVTTYAISLFGIYPSQN